MEEKYSKSIDKGVFVWYNGIAKAKKGVKKWIESQSLSVKLSLKKRN